ncbi:hypothetical protein Pcinc_037846 [Petrolisthes cinctipes]|uniref:Peptidase S1 domain-containing protein n=1 Tax=Petrolisthes cinctipes TaxID=88211 RepID=A0AAE1BRM8_PETCI|nr:hypothetical protein Pcinc_037846 [Petrolisthes cinctipes]
MVTAGPLILRLPPPPPPPGQNVLLEERKLLNTHGRIKLVCSSVVVGSVVAPSSQINGSSLLLTELMDDNIRSVVLASLDPGVGTTVTLTGWGKKSDRKSCWCYFLGVTAGVTSLVASAGCESGLPHGFTSESGLPHGFTSESGLPHGFTSESGLPHGFTSESGLPHGFTSESGLPHGFTSESGLPHGFTRVTYFLDWIQANSGITP